MTGQTLKGYKSNYIIARELGKGGEGIVYDLVGNDHLVLKLYNEELNAEKIRKIKYMALMSIPDVQKFAAWPVDIVTESNGRAIGFVMKKLTNYVPLHMLFSPMDRKKLFPDKGYDFLIHVARNLATAFHNLHQQGIIVGDVNEGNILVDATGMVAFIDCDSFQIKEGSIYHLCEVGVPRYTPPELLIQANFDKTVRSVNTDIFSMSILIFQLLFLGRHPYAGRNLTKEDITEENAIKNHEFAYSLRNNSKRLSPPEDSLDIRYLPEGLISLFHQSFESSSDRQGANQWVKELDNFKKEIVACPVSKIHNYPKKAISCPWCNFSKTRGIVYFIDDTYLKQNPIADIDKFVQGFKLEALSFPNIPTTSPQNNIKSDEVDPKYGKYKTYKQIAQLLVLFTFAGLCFINLWAIAPGIIVLLTLNDILPYAKRIKIELKRRKDEFNNLKSNLESVIKDYNNRTELSSYTRSSTQFTTLLANFKRLPDEYLDKKRAIEEQLYNLQLETFLQQFHINNYDIQSFGYAKKQTLIAYGVQYASDISKLNKIKIRGIGPKNIQILMSWQREFISKFPYKPDSLKLNAEMTKVAQEIAVKKSQLEAVIRRDYQSLQLLRTNIRTKYNLLLARYHELNPKVYKAELDYAEFKKIAS